LLEEVEGSAPEERAIAFAAFRLLGEHHAGPPMVAVDDVQWLDAASASVLGFALRGLAAGPVAILLARRSSGSEAAPLGLDRALADGGLRHVRLEALSVGATHRLLRSHLGVSYPRPTLIELHGTAGGNPSYALELARAAEQTGLRARTGGRLTVPGSLTGLVAASLAALPADVREVLGPAALLGEAPRSLVAAAADDPSTASRRLRVAEAAGIVDAGSERVRFGHPLPAAAVKDGLDPDRRRRLHRRLAGLVADPERRARHSRSARAARRPRWPTS
jgi:hypothetical protein